MSSQNGKKLTANFEAEPDNTSLVVLPGTPEQIMRDALALGYRKIVFGWSNQIQLEVFVEEDLEFLLQAHLDIQDSDSEKHIVVLGEGKLVVQALCDHKRVVADVVYSPLCHKDLREEHPLILPLQEYRARWNSVARQLLEQLKTAGLSLVF